MSSAPANNITDDSNDDRQPPDYDEYEDAARHTEEFLASFMHDSDDGYDDEPVRITANMMSSTDDDMWILEPDQNEPSDKTSTAPATPSLDPLSYANAFHADLTTIEGINMHESRIYQHGLTPSEIRHNIKLALRSSLPHQPMVAFQAKDIPPAELDPRTNMVLHALLAERGRAGQDPKAQNETNRTMFQVYSDSQFIIHDNNFFSCCKPHLRNLPRHTAFQLQSMRTNLEAKELPPYRPIQFDALPEPTVPKFKPRTTANPPLQPRAQWMQRRCPPPRPRPACWQR